MTRKKKVCFQIVSFSIGCSDQVVVRVEYFAQKKNTLALKAQKGSMPWDNGITLSGFRPMFQFENSGNGGAFSIKRSPKT